MHLRAAGQSVTEKRPLGAGVAGLFPGCEGEADESRAKRMPFEGVNRAPLGPIEPASRPTLEGLRGIVRANLTAGRLLARGLVMGPRALEALRAWEREHGIDAVTGRPIK